MRKSGLGGRGRRCVAPGCERRVQPGAALCPRHRRSGYGEEVERGLRQLMAVTETDGQTDRRADGQKERAVEAFRRRVERGDYGELFDEPVRAILEEAGAERGLVRESGALRLTLARLLAEEEDAVRLSLGVSRVATASARVERTLHVIRGGDTELEQWLGEMLAAESRRVCEEADERAEAAAAERERERLLRERTRQGMGTPVEWVVDEGDEGGNVRALRDHID